VRNYSRSLLFALSVCAGVGLCEPQLLNAAVKPQSSDEANQFNVPARAASAVSGQTSDVAIQPPQEIIHDKEVSDENWKMHEYGRYNRAGVESLSEENYAKALQYFDQALQMKFEARTALDRDRCLIKLGRPEALEGLKATFKKSGYKDEFVALVDCQIKLRLFDDAFATCDTFQREQSLNGPTWLERSKVLLAQEKRQAAVDCLKEGYYHCFRNGHEKQDYRDALSELGESVPTTVPKNRSANKKILELIDYILQLSEPVEEHLAVVAFERILSRDLKFVWGGSATDWFWEDWSTPINIISLYESGAQDKRQIMCRINLDLSYVTKEDLQTAQSKLLRSGSIAWPDKNDTGPRSTMTPRPNTVVVCKNGTLEFGFSRIDGKQLEYVIRTYDPAVVRQFSRDCVEHTIAHSQELLNHKRNHEATEYLLK
jgi:tetratricopeptide (TPR) repeat protein